MWLPIFQVIPMLRAARMAGAWFFAFCSPVIGAIALVFLWNAQVARPELWAPCIYGAASLLALFALNRAGVAGSKKAPLRRLD